MDDITSEWATLKALPGSKPRGEDIDLRREYMSMGDHPEFVYRLHESGYSMHYASLWRMKCHGEKRRSGYGNPQHVECWVVEYDALLWKGDRYDLLATKPPERDKARVFLAPKKQCCVTLDEVRHLFVKERDRNLRNAAEYVLRCRTDISGKLAEIAMTEAHIASMNGFIPEFFSPDTCTNQKPSTP